MSLLKCLVRLYTAPPEAQKDLFRALIDNITVYDDKIVMWMFIQADRLSDVIQPLEKEKSPTPVKDRNEAFNTPNRNSVDSAGSVSNWRPIKGE